MDLKKLAHGVHSGKIEQCLSYSNGLSRIDEGGKPEPVRRIAAGGLQARRE
jgi:hypothetical protein